MVSSTHKYHLKEENHWDDASRHSSAFSAPILPDQCYMNKSVIMRLFPRTVIVFFSCGLNALDSRQSQLRGPNIYFRTSVIQPASVLPVVHRYLTGLS